MKNLESFESFEPKPPVFTFAFETGFLTTSLDFHPTTNPPFFSFFWVAICAIFSVCEVIESNYWYIPRKKSHDT